MGYNPTLDGGSVLNGTKISMILGVVADQCHLCVSMWVRGCVSQKVPAATGCSLFPHKLTNSHTYLQGAENEQRVRVPNGLN